MSARGHECMRCGAAVYFRDSCCKACKAADPVTCERWAVEAKRERRQREAAADRAARIAATTPAERFA